MAVNVDNLEIEISSKLDEVIKKLDNTKKNTEKNKKASDDWAKSFKKLSSIATSSLNAMSKGFSLLSGSTNALKSLASADNIGLKESFTLSMQYIENLNLLKESSAEYYNSAISFQNQLNEAFSTNISEATRYQAIFTQMSSAMGLSSKTANMLSENMTKLTYDISSFYNIDQAQAFNKLQSGLVGQARALYSLGMDVTVTKLQSVSDALGIEKSVSEMSQAEKMLLRYIAIMQQSGNAQTDMARTINQPANQLRILKNNVMECGRQFANVFIGTFGAILPYINAVVMVIKELLKTLATLAGFGDYITELFGGSSSVDIDWSDDLNDNLGKAEKTSKKINENLQSIDEIHNLTEDTSSGGGTSGMSMGGIDPKLLDSLKGYDNLMGSVSSKAQDIRDKIMEWLGFTKMVDEETQAIYWLYTGEGWSEVGKKLSDGFSYAINYLINGINSIPWNDIGIAINEVLMNIDYYSILTNLLLLFSTITKSIVQMLNGINFVSIFAKISRAVQKTINVLIKSISKVNVKSLAKSISNTLISAIIEFRDFLNNVNWTELAQTIVDKIVDFVTTFDWLGALIGILDILLKLVGIITESLIVAIAQLIRDILIFVGEKINDVLQPIIDFNVNVLLSINDLKTKIINVVNNIIDFVKTLPDKIRNKINEVISIFGNAFTGAKTKVENIISGIVSTIKETPNIIKNGLSVIPQIFYNAFTNAKNKVSEVWQGVKDLFNAGGKIFEGFTDGVLNVFKSIVNKLIEGINTVIGLPFKGINKLLNGIRSADILGVKPFEGLWSKDPIGIPEIPKLKTGGYVSTGQMFIANEAGPELVGNIGSRTAVVNNEQIVQSVSRGVAQAVSSVMGGTGETEIYGEIDGEKLIKIVVNGVNGMTAKDGKFPFKLA